MAEDDADVDGVVFAVLTVLLLVVYLPSVIMTVDASRPIDTPGLEPSMPGLRVCGVQRRRATISILRTRMMTNGSRQ